MEEDKKLWEFRDENTDNKGEFKDQMKAANDRIEDINRRRASIVAKVDSSNPPSSTDRLIEKEESSKQ
jgi:ribosome biogenesis GTPase A